MDHKDLLISDLNHFGESFWRNEEIGEKRFTFFATLVAAALSALALVDEKVGGTVALANAAGMAALALLVIGLLSYVRLIHRNRVTDAYKDALARIRKLYIESCNNLPPSMRGYKPVNKVESWFSGGYAETMGVMNGLLLGGYLLFTRNWNGGDAAAGGASLAVMLVTIAVWFRE